MDISRLDILSANASDLRDLLQTRQASSVQLVKAYQSQIARHDATIKAFICLAPEQDVIAAAASLDKERSEGRLRSQLHGIPVVVKDCFITAAHLGMSTTAGSWALVGAKSSKNSAVEFAGMKMTMMMPGWSAYGGQTISPYVGPVENGDTILGHSAPGGSSTGSAVAVAAGFSPLGIGAETIGSIITPASRAGLYALKPTAGSGNSRMFVFPDFLELSTTYTEQNDIVKAFENTDTKENVARLRDGLRKQAKAVLEPVFQENEINIIAAPADSSLCIHAAAAGYPIATVPLGHLTYNQRPFGLCLMARDGCEEDLLRFMHLYESVTPPRPVPRWLGRA
ncbi:hypothetical protein KVR01_009094 [Diaporthe batatas]|uniref:uncharacterized protein n=1 Tax=Diaporthe batatas TaxID=748121 RepID=UPI001D045227|nr:uncharacterized protein KVR01_009094 [Diaporthe batatas]KAG8160830.1 hypothetical protein KVR01_009094 [Diaporthe batatas]